MQPSQAPGGRDRRLPRGLLVTPLPAADFMPAPPPLQALQREGDTPLRGSPAEGENGPRPLHQPSGLPAPCPAAVSDPRSRTPSLGGFPSQIPRPQPLDLLSPPAPGRRPPRTKLPGRREAPPLPGLDTPPASNAPGSAEV